MPEDVRDRFSSVAANYVTSRFHSSERGYQEVVDLVRPAAGEVALDVATGTGHSAFALAPAVARVTGLDLTAKMLHQARGQAAKKGFANVDWVLGEAEELPFPEETFDIYMVRAAPHHFRDLDAALAEARRVLRPGGRACFIDCAPPSAARAVLHEVEMRRDPSHVRSRTVEEWVERVEAAGLAVESAERRELDWDHDGWMDVMNVPAATRAELAALIIEAPAEARAELQPELREGKLWHRYWHCLIRAQRP